MPSPSTASTKRACKNANQPPPVYMKNQFRLIYITTRVRESGPWSFHGRMNENSRECTMWIWVFRLRVFVPNSAGRPPVDDVITAATLIATHTDISRKVSGSGPWTISRPSSALLLCSPMIPDAAFTPYPPGPSCLPISLPGLFGDCRQRNRFPCDQYRCDTISVTSISVSARTRSHSSYVYYREPVGETWCRKKSKIP